MKTSLLLPKSIFLFFLVMVTATTFVKGQVIISANTNWSAISPTPTSSTTIEIRNGATLTVNVTNAVCASIQIGATASPGNFGVLTFSGANPQLTVSGTIQVGGFGNTARSGTINFTSGSTLIGDDLVIGSTGGTPGELNTVTMTAGGNLTVNSITFNANNDDNTITQGASSTVTVNGPVTINQPSANTTNNNWNVNSGTATVSGLINLAGTNTTTSRDGSLVITTGTLNADGGISIAGTTAATKNITMTGTSSILNVGGTGISGAANATFTAGTGTSTVNYNAGGNQANVANYTYNNLSISNSGTKTLLGTTDVNGTLTVSAGTVLSLSTFSITPSSVVLECGATTGSSVTGTGSFSLQGNVSVNTVGSGSDAAIISAPVALNGTRVFTVADDGSSATDLVMNSVISTANGLTKAGAGTMQLNAVNTYSGTTTINAGTLLYNTNNAIAAGAVTVSGGIMDIGTFTDAVGTVTLTSGSIEGSTGVLTGTSYAVQDGTISAILAGAVNLTKTTSGTVTLTGVNTYTGITAINAGILSVSTIGNGGVAGNIGAATSAAANLVLGGGTLQYTGATATTNRNYTFTTGTTSTIELVTNDLTLTGASAATTGGFIKIGNGTLILTGANLHTGTTTVADRTLEYGANNVLATGAVTVNGGILDIKTFSDAVGTVTLVDGEINGTTGVLTGSSYAVQDGIITAILAGTGGLTKTTTGTVTLSAVNTFTGAVTITGGILSVSTIADGGVACNLGAASTTAANLTLNGGTLRYTGTTATTNRNFVLATATTSTFNISTNTLIINGASTNTTGAMIKEGNGTLVLGGNNLHTGSTTISEGTLKLGASDRITGSLIVESVFDMNGFSETVANLAGTGTVTSSAAGTLTLTSGNTSSTSFTGIIENGSATSIAITKNGSGILALSGANTYTGTTTINAGTILLENANVIPDNPVVLGGGILNTGSAGGFSETIGDLTVSVNSTIALGTGVHTLTIANSSGNTWAATTLSVTGWTGIGGSGGAGTQGVIMVGVGGLTPAQLTKISFTGFGAGAVITGSGELVPASGSTIFYSQGNLAPNTLANWNSNRLGGGFTPANFTSANQLFVIQDQHTMTTSATWTVTGAGSKIQIENGGTLVANNAITVAASSTFRIDDGGTYTHNNTTAPSTSIFAGIESFDPASTVNITNWQSASTVLTTGVTLPFGNLQINWNSGGTWAQSWTGAVNLTAGNFTITSLGSGTNQFRCTPASTGSALALEIGGNLTVGTATFALVGGGSNGSKSCSVNVYGNVSITGTIDMSSSSTTSGAVELNVGGDFAVSGSGVLRNTTGAGTRTVNFNKPSGTQTFTSTAGGINTSAITFNAGKDLINNNTLQLLSNFVMNNTASLNVLNGTTLDCGTNIVQATVANTQGNFNLNDGATIMIGSTAGIAASGASGNIQTATTRVFNPNAIYIYNGLAAQVTGTALTNANILEINNAAGVTLTANAAVNGSLKLISGKLDCSSNTISVTNSATGAVTRTSGHVIGNLQRSIATGTNTYVFHVGTASGYTPASIAFSGVSGTGNITVKANDGTSSNFPSTLHATKKLNRHWIVTNSGVTGFTANVSFTYLAGDLAGGITTGELKAYRADPGPAYTFPAVANYNFTGTTYTYSNISSFSSTANFTEFGAGACKVFTATFSKTMASACGGGADGTITITPSGGNTPYTYNWTSNPSGFSASTAAITGLSPRDYSCLVTEATGCTIPMNDITIWQAQAPTVSNNGGISGSCNNTGYIVLYGSYGVPPFTYSVDGVTYQASNTFLNLAAGTYTGYVKDSAGCIGTKPNIVIAAAAPIVVTAHTRPASSCANNGSIELYRTGGIAPYTYSLDDVTYQSSNTFTNKAGGTYTGWVKDSKGCKTSLAGIIVTQAPAITVSATKINTSACSNSGYIEIQAGGGVPGYTYSITGPSGPWQSSNRFTGLAAGTYPAWVQDSKGCKAVQFGVVIGTNSAPTITVTANPRSASSCANNGSIELYRSGGSGPYTYSLNNVTYQVSNTFTGLAGGTYTGWVKDVNGCTGSLAGIIVNQDPALTTTESHGNTSACVNDGFIQVRPSGGAAPYTYSLDNITYQGSAYFTGLAAGNYTAWAKDLKGCTVSVNVTISQVPVVVNSGTLAASSCIASDGTITLFPSGGFGPYTYSLDNVTYQGSNVFTGLTAGTYTGYIKDSRNCVGSQSNITVGPSCPPIANNANRQQSVAKLNGAGQQYRIATLQVYPNPSSSVFTLKLDGNNSLNTIMTITDLLGRRLTQVNITGKQVFTFGAELEPGIYTLQVSQGEKVQSIKVIKE